MFSTNNLEGRGPALRIRLFCGFVVLLASMLARSHPQDQLGLILNEEFLPGIVWVTVDENTASAGGMGYAELASGRPMTAKTRVQVGSVTKTLIAMGVLQLVSAERLDLDADVERLLPELNWNNPWRDQAPITVQHLLEHTAGLDNIRMWQFLNTGVTADTPLANAFPQSHDYLLRVRTRPGSQYSYSNMGYAVLGLVIEKVTAERYEEYLARELLEPLGMVDSSFFLITQNQDSRLAMGYLDGGTPQQSVPMFLRPAGQFTTTASDMGLFLRFLLGSGSVKGEQVIRSEFLDRLGRPSTTEATLSGLLMGHGLALAARDRHGVLGECHPGTTFGFRAYLCVFRAEGKAFFYAVNADDESADYERFTGYFIEQVGVAPVAEVPAVPIRRLGDYAGLYTLAPPNMAQFAWLDWMFNSIWVSVDQQRNGLVIHSLQGQPRLLLPVGDSLFRDAERRVASHVFLGSGNDALSNGLATWRKTSPLVLCLGWASLVIGALGLLYIVFRGFWLMFRGRALANREIMLPWFCLLAFALPAYLYTEQPFLHFGEVTAASVILAALSGALPLLLGFALFGILRSRRSSLPDLCAVLASVQLCLVLILHGALPIVFWR